MRNLQYIELKHIEKGGEVIDEASELHIDDIVLNVLGHLDKDSSKIDKGSEKSKIFFQEASESEYYEHAKAVCLIEATDFEVWKVGYEKEGYQIFFVTENTISHFGSVYYKFIKHYLAGTRIDELDIGEGRPLESDSLAGFSEEPWYDEGVVRFDPTVDEKEKSLELFIYVMKTKGRVGDYNPDLGQSVKSLDPFQIALVTLATTDAKETEFRDKFVGACQEYNNEAYQSACGLINDVKKNMP